ncbi:MAG TPA: hypothetical protein DCF91_06490 [Porphyromonadaceae bacterium]|nr:hypothetical protein [Porphyromonadaceae bacterium]
MKQHQCNQCSFRAKYDNNSKSILGRLWRWHINICPGWKAYFNSLPEDQQQELRNKYSIVKK